MNINLIKIGLISALLFVAAAIIVLLYQGRYFLSGILFIVTWAVLFGAGAYGIPLYVKSLILKYLDTKNGEAKKSDIIIYCTSKNRYFLEEIVTKWITDLETKNKIKIQDGVVLKRN